MALITSEASLEASAETAWAKLRDVGAADRAFPGVLIASHLQGDVRTVSFADGTVIRERIIDIDEAQKRVCYAVIGGRFDHHSASMQVIAEGPNRSRFIWVSEFGPDNLDPMVRALVEQGTAAFRRTMAAESQA